MPHPVVAVRERLYDLTVDPIFNPVEPVEEYSRPLVVDLSFDVTNHTVVSHPNTDEVRALLKQADIVACDNQVLVNVVRDAIPELSTVYPYQFGFNFSNDIESDEGLRIGLLNYDFFTRNNNDSHSRMLKALAPEYLVLGEEVPGLECEVMEVAEFEMWAALVDILVLPSLPSVANSLSLPLSAMMAGTTIIASNTGGYSALQQASGVFLTNSSKVKDWRGPLQFCENDLRRLTQLKKFNRAYARQTSTDSIARLTRLIKRVTEKLEVA